MKTAMVTGASRGIGEATARRLARDGFAVALCCKSSCEKAEKIKADLCSENLTAECFYFDVSVSEQVNEAVKKIEHTLGEISVLVNNAAVAEQALFTDITDEMWQKMLGINLTGVFNCSRAVLPDMIKNKNGVIINISSMWGQVGASCETHYSAAKAGVIGLTKALAKEVGLSNIRVNAIAPGVIKTDMLNSFSNEDLDELISETPLSRLGTPKDIASAVSFLASDEASFITGQVLGVNGGFVI